MSWASDLTANTLDATYINNWLDVSGNCTIRGTSKNLITGTGDVSLNGTTTFTQQIIYNTDMSLNRSLIVGGDVSMSAGSFNVIRDVAINGTLSVGSYKTGSISLSAINSGGGGGGGGGISDYTINATDTTFNVDMAYNAPLKINGDISLNDSVTYSYLYTSPQLFKSTDAKTSVAQKWQDIEISSTGQYQIAVVGGNRITSANGVSDVSGNVWISTNYGVTWTEKVVGGGVQCWISAMISGDGSIMMVKGTQNILYRSIDFGANWTQLTSLGSIPDVTYADMASGALGAVRRPAYPMFMTTDGNTLITGTSDATTTWLTRLIISKNGGTSWTVLPHDNGNPNKITSYNMSKSGQYICITYGNNLLPKYSPDYGTNFYTITNVVNMQALNTSNILLYSSGLCAISNNGYAYMHDGTTFVYAVNVTSGTVSGGANNAAVIKTSTSVGTINNQSIWSINTSYNGQYVTIYGRTPATIYSGATIIYVPCSYASYDYGATFRYIIGNVIMNTGTFLNRVWSTRFTSDNKYIATVKENDYIYVSRLLFTGSSTQTQVSASTTVNVPSRIRFSDGTDISANMYPNNKEADGTTFKATTFRNMIVQGSFASNPQLSASDYRIKTNVQTLDETHVLDNLRPVRYYQTQLARNDIGFIAHELQEQYPDLVDGEKDGDNMQSVDYTGILALLINEVQRLKADIKHTRAAIAAKKAAA
jgi:hypothetical protein